MDELIGCGQGRDEARLARDAEICGWMACGMACGMVVLMLCVFVQGCCAAVKQGRVLPQAELRD